jgi:hypothetical protein
MLNSTGSFLSNRRFLIFNQCQVSLPLTSGLALSLPTILSSPGRQEGGAARECAGQTLWMVEEEHLPENLSDQPAEIILVEQKA